MAPSARWTLAAALPILAAGVALAGRKADPRPEPPPAPAPAPEPSPVAAPEVPAPTLFPAGLPVVLDSLPPGLASLSAQTCNGCHWTAHDGWSTGGHAHAWSDTTFQSALHSAGNSTTCLGCHLPIASQHDQLATGFVDGDLTRPRLVDNASFDASLMSEGVTCAACHVRNGTVLGVHATNEAPHPVVASSELGNSELCATCHQLTWPEADRPFYDTFGEWKASAYASAGVSCQSCHMPGGDHDTAQTVARALTTLLSIPHANVTRGQELAVNVTLINSGAGHSVPTGNPFKSWTIEIALVDAAGKDLAPVQRTVLARTVEPKPPWKTTADERIAAGASKQWTGKFTPNTKGAPGQGALIARAVRGSNVVQLRRIPVEIR